MQSIQTEKAPLAIGTYSQAVQCGRTVYLSGQIPLDPNTMALCHERFEPQMIQVIKNLSAVCQAAGGSLAHLVKLTVYLTDLNNFSIVNQVMSQYFQAPYPARAAIEVSALPRGSQVEIDGIMVLPE